MAGELISGRKLRLRVNRSIAIGGGLLLIICALAVLAPLVAPHAPDANDFRNRLAPPGGENIFGTDNYGRDVFSRVIYGMRISLGIGLSVAVLTGIAGIILGAISGFFDRLDGLLMRTMDAAMAFPSTLLAISIAAALGPSVQNAVIALFLVYTPRTARVIRSSVLQLRHADYVESARALGAGPWRLLVRHILPNAMAPFIVQTTFVFAVAILAEAVLSFIGVGPQPPTPTLGNVIAEGRAYIEIAPWISLLPGLAIVVLVLSLNLLGDGLRDATDPRLIERGH